jgi:hypothetical protein
MLICKRAALHLIIEESLAACGRPRTKIEDISGNPTQGLRVLRHYML